MDLDDIELPATPAGEQARWFLHHMATGGDELTEDEVRARTALPAPPAEWIAQFKENNQRRAFTVVKVDTPSADEVAFTVDHGDGKPFTMTLTLEQEPPHRIVRLWWSRAVADDVTFRAAVPSDSPRLNDLEVRAPMTVGSNTTIVYDRGADFLAFSRLMEENICFVGERGDELVGLACGAAHTVRIGGQEHRVMLLHHLRVPVEHRKGGVFSTLNGRVFGAYDRRTDGAYGYTALDNAEAMRIGGPGTWSVTVHRAVLDCAAVADDADDDVRVATADDATQIVETLNACHDREEAFLPYTVDSLRARLERAPDLYTWDQLLLTDGAVLGVWPAGMKVTVDDGTVRSEDVRAVVLDHGFLPGREDRLERLLRTWCRRLVAAGHTELMTLTSEPSPGFDVVRMLAKRMDPFAFRMSVPEPAGTGERGVYVDAVYF